MPFDYALIDRPLYEPSSMTPNLHTLYPGRLMNRRYTPDRRNIPNEYPLDSQYSYDIRRIDNKQAYTDIQILSKIQGGKDSDKQPLHPAIEPEATTELVSTSVNVQAPTSPVPKDFSVEDDMDVNSTGDNSRPPLNEHFEYGDLSIVYSPSRWGTTTIVIIIVILVVLIIILSLIRV